MGWDEWRHAVFTRQRDPGVVPPGTVLTPRPSWVRGWDELNAEERRMHARQQEVFAGFLTHTDAQVGRVLSWLRDAGLVDDTLVMVFSDNGASAEGGQQGSVNEHRFTAHLRDTVADNLAAYDDWGGFSTYNHYSWAWAWAGNTPHKLWKRYTWLGGTRTPLIVQWPGRVAAPGVVRSQFTHVVDLLPTILDAIGIDTPRQVDGVPQQVMDGRSFLGAQEDPAAAEFHHTQYFEMLGSRSIYHDGWKATTNHISTGVLDEEELAIGSRNFDEDRWELFNLSEDFSEADDRSADEPERLRHLTELWTAEAERNQVFPISDGLVDRLSGFIAPVYPAGAARTFRPGAGPVHDESIPPLWGGFQMTADVESTGTGTQGVVLALGDWFGGYALYLAEEAVHFTFARSGDALHLSGPAPASGPHRLVVTYTLGESGAPGRLELRVDGTLLDGTAVEGMLPLALQHGGAGLRLGFDSGFPVSPRYVPPAHFTGAVHEVTIETPAAMVPDPADEVRAGLHSD
jgi:arylsulfatase